MLIDLGQLALLLAAWRRRTSLEPGVQAEVRALVGINESREDVLARPPVHDLGEVVGRRVVDGERMRVQRTWLWATQTRRWALLLDFAVGGQSTEQSVTSGRQLRSGSVLSLRCLPHPERLLEDELGLEPSQVAQLRAEGVID
ncbi:MAG: hypothetical protein LC797_21375 [Chloroflexi bacterium]|nr:hypothetical protein [Chloroflexota bacterium]